MGQACPSAALAATEEELPFGWRAALDSLLKATNQAGRAWGCTGARLSLSLDPNGAGAILRLEERDGRTVERHIATPEDLVPTGEALLASPERPAPPPPASDDAISTRPTPRPTLLKKPIDVTHDVAIHGPRVEPRLLVDGVLTGRYTGQTSALWGGAAIRGTIPIGAWSAGIWARFDLPAWVFTKVPEDFSMSEVCVGLSVGRRLVASPLELHLLAGPSLAVVAMEGGMEPDFAEGGRVDARVGVELRSLWTIAGVWRAVVSLDGEIAPGAAGSAKGRQVDPALPALPTYTMGLSIGVQASVL